MVKENFSRKGGPDLSEKWAIARKHPLDSIVRLEQGEDGKLILKLPEAYLRCSESLPKEEQEKLARLDEENELYSKEPMDGPGQVTFDGVPLQDLSNELDDMLYSCTSNEYCQQHGYGDFCGADGRCSADDGWENVDWTEDDGWEEVDWTEQAEPRQETCPLSFGILLLPLMLILKRRN